MAFTYLGDLSTTLDKTRFAIGDTDSTAVLFTDAEINGTITIYTDWMLSAAALADAQAAKYARRATMSVDGASFQYGELSANFRALAIRLRAQYNTRPDAVAKPIVGGISKTDMDTQRDNSDREPSRFEVGMHDFPGTLLSSATGEGTADGDGI